ncbi:peptidoglycan DD-metalloendopeptidase family protein [Marinobacterium weihaiense]|uniref:Peptidoglycan DD-metalloendopeptidase family protein n=1 Tax=Marinobacterium weihaiense TaxID=2851016 RepID=A0ABS6M8L5_9GAMM|nr:peptidoglycan DD-metalloendopeptidase family protein [Marinobacterium weihaiense]MBV0932520.1 peptidoglycan DD-metalloendopeptidase family protein [Marinobacterium weihaiense]
MPKSLLLVLTCLVLLLGGCSTGYAPVDERSLGARVKGPAPSSYKVRRGDTLYSIAFRYGLNYRQVARWNGIRSQDYIYPGQRLRLRPPARLSSRPSATVGPDKPVAAMPKPASRPAPPPAAKPPGRPSSTSGASSSTAVQWQWPYQGRIVQAFGRGQPANKGIDIAGRKGDAVKAAAPGDVVYAGNGLLGYGNLVIINHSKRYLSAYAHNSRIFVREGDKVKAGEKIAEIGKTGATRTMLHFEIRRDGNPVDPLGYLPKR